MKEKDTQEDEVSSRREAWLTGGQIRERRCGRGTQWRSLRWARAHLIIFEEDVETHASDDQPDKGDDEASDGKSPEGALANRAFRNLVHD